VVCLLLIATYSVGGWWTPAAAQVSSDAVAVAVHHDLTRVAATGAVLGVIARDGVRWMESFGSVGMDGAEPMHPREKMHLGTFGDHFLAGLALQMEDQGVVDLNAPVHRLLPGLSAGVGGRTLNALLMHTGGFDASPLVARARGTSAERQSVDRDRQLLNDQVIMLPADLVRSPSPHHTLLAGTVLEARGGGSLEGAFRTYLLRPAGVAEVSFAPEGGTPNGVRPGFQVRLAPGDPYGLAPFPEPSVLQPQQRIWAHAFDFSRIMQHLLFEIAARDALLTPRIADPFDAPGAGAFSLGFRWDSSGRGRWVGEGPGYTTEVRFLPLGSRDDGEGFLLFAMANGGASTLDRALTTLEDWVRGLEQSPTSPSLQPVASGPAPFEPAELRPALAGRYRNGSEILHLVWDNGMPAVDLGLGTRLPVRAGISGELEAYLPDGRTALRFRVASAGPAVLLLAQGIAFVKEAIPGAPRRD